MHSVPTKPSDAATAFDLDDSAPFFEDAIQQQARDTATSKQQADQAQQDQFAALHHFKAMLAQVCRLSLLCLCIVTL